MTMRRWITTSVALALAVPRFSKAAPTDEPVAVTEGAAPHIDAGALGPGYEALTPELEGRADALVRQTDVALARVEVRVAWVDPETFEYAIDVVVDPAGADADPVTRRQTCRGCTTEELVGAAESALRAALGEAIAESEGEPPRAVEPAPPSERRRPDDASAPAFDLHPKPSETLGRMGWSGVGMLGAGAAFALTGGALVGVGARTVDERPTQVRNFRPAGIALVCVGAGALVTGAVLLGVDLRQRGPVAAAPIVGPRRAGIAIYGRF